LTKAIISVESCSVVYAVSPVRAPARQMGVHSVFDANDNIWDGIHYFSQMLSRFKQNVASGRAVYNTEPEAVEKYKGVPPFEETQNYVKPVLGHLTGMRMRYCHPGLCTSTITDGAM
jgi:soluble lytic murein transglycosylase-like protein